MRRGVSLALQKRKVDAYEAMLQFSTIFHWYFDDIVVDYLTVAVPRYSRG